MDGISALSITLVGELFKTFEVWFLIGHCIIVAVYGSKLTEQRENGWCLAIGYTVTALVVILSFFSDAGTARY